MRSHPLTLPQSALRIKGNSRFRPRLENLEDRVVPDVVVSAPPFDNFLGQALHVVRVASGFSQERLADSLSLKLRKRIRQTYISKIEKGRNKITLKRLGLLCEFLQVSPVHVVDMAVFLAEQGSAPDDAALRDSLAKVTKRLATKVTPPPIEQLLPALQTELKQRLSERGAQFSRKQPIHPKKQTKTADG